MCYARIRIFACGHQTEHFDYCNRIRNNHSATCSVMEDIARMRGPCYQCSVGAGPRRGSRANSSVMPSIEHDSDSHHGHQPSIHDLMNRMNLGGRPGQDSDSDSDAPRRRRRSRSRARSPSPARHRGRRSQASPSAVHYGRSRSPSLHRGSSPPRFQRFRSPPRRRRSPSPDIDRISHFHGHHSPPRSNPFRNDFGFGPGRRDAISRHRHHPHHHHHHNHHHAAYNSDSDSG